MEEKIKQIISKYPWSKLERYWDLYELSLKIESWPWCFKISWTQEQVKNLVDLIISKYEPIDTSTDWH